MLRRKYKLKRPHTHTHGDWVVRIYPHTYISNAEITLNASVCGMNREDNTELMRGKKWLRERGKTRRNSNKSTQETEMRAVRIRGECVEGMKGEAVREVRKERDWER